MKVIFRRGFFILSVCALGGLLTACNDDLDEIDPEDEEEEDVWYPEIAEEDIPTAKQKATANYTDVVVIIPEEEIPL